MNLPTGTVTFLFTDIEGSTRLWDEYPEAMRPALARHDALLRASIEARNGYVFKTMGDAFCAAFHIAPDALHAALAAQQALASEPWPQPVKIKVRMALHTGVAETRDNDYFGQPLNRIARLLGTGHGGQILLSGVTSALCRDVLPLSASLKAMGEHRLRDLNRPETIFQLLHPDLPSELPPLKTLDALPNNLPQQMTSFIGREKELAEIQVLMEKTRLLTLLGIGGGGKTRLALQVAADLMEQYPDGVWLIELASLADPALVPQSVASVWSLDEQVGRSYTQTLIEYLKSKRLLLVLDNCEHLVSACAQLSDALLRVCPHIKILASSREGLSIQGELTYRVPSLSLPDAGQPATLESLMPYEAVRLFLERAVLCKPDFAATDQTAPALVSVCQRLDGIPLAIELAAARVRSLTVEEINTRLDNRFRLLTGGDRAALPRQQTLRAMIDWSYDLLNAQERLQLVRLSVFAGGGTLEAAEQVCNGEGIEDWEVLDLLTSLVDKSLVIAETQGEETRYRMLETLRQYAQDRLAESQEHVVIQGRHRDYFLARAEEILPKLEGPQQAHWLEVLEAEHDNLRRALRFCLEDADGGGAGLRLAGALQRFWWTRGHLSEGRQHLAAALARPVGPEHLQARAGALNGSGVLALLQSDYEVARTLHEESLAIYRELGDKRGITSSLNNLGNVVHDQGDYAAARRLHEESLAIRRELGDRRGIASSLGNMGNIALRQGDYEAARVMYEESLATFRELGERRGVALCLNSLGNVAHDQGDYEASRRLQQEALTIERELGDRRAIANSLNNLGNAALFLGDYTTAHTLHEESLAIRRELGDRWGVASSLSNLGIIAVLQNDYAAARVLHRESLVIKRELEDKRGIAESLEAQATLDHKEQRATRAAHLWGAATSLREAIGLAKPQNEREDYDQEIAQARSALGQAAFTAAWEEGHAMTWEQAVVYALEESSS